MAPNTKAASPSELSGIGLGDFQENLAQARFEEYQKRLATKIVFPLVVFISVVLILCVWRWDIKFFLGLASIVFVVALNAAISFAKERSDIRDMTRWIFSLLADTYLMWAFELTPGFLFITWSIVCGIGPLSEIHKPAFRIPTMVLSTICYFSMLSFFSFQGEELSTSAKVFYLSGFLGVLAVFWSLERYVRTELRSHLTWVNRYQGIVEESRKVKRAAIVGMQQRAIAHELDNMLGVIEITLDNIQNSPKEKQIIQSALENLKKIDNLILKDLDDRTQNEWREYSISSFIEDLRLISERFLRKKNIELRVETSSLEESLNDVLVRERVGSLILIGYNLIKNSADSIEQRRVTTESFDGRVDLVVEKSKNDGSVIVSICDNGIGMSESKVRELLKGSLISDKEQGNGLGILFCLEQVELNNYRLEVSSTPGQGSKFSIHCPA